MEAARKAIELKYSLLPYIYTCAYEAYETGMPLMRAMFLEFPDDRECRRTDMQFMFGESLLVAPVVEKGARTREVYLPKGRWYDWYDGTIYEGGHYVTVPAQLDKTPVLVKEGGMVPTGPVVQNTEQADGSSLLIRCYPKEGEKTSYTLYEDDGESLAYQRGENARTTFSCLLESGVYHIEYNTACYGGFAAPSRVSVRMQFPGKKAKAVYVNGKKVRSRSTNNFLTVSL